MRVNMVKVRLTKVARSELQDILAFVSRQPWGDPQSRQASIRRILRALRHMPEQGRPFKVVGGRTYRTLIVDDRIYIAYIYTPGKGANDGTISVRGIRHGSMRNPLRGVREITRPLYFAQIKMSPSDWDHPI